MIRLIRFLLEFFYNDEDYDLHEIAPRKAKKLSYYYYINGWNDGYDKRYVDFKKDPLWKCKPELLTYDECKVPYPKVLGYFIEDLKDLKFINMPSFIKDNPHAIPNVIHGYKRMKNNGKDTYICIDGNGYLSMLSTLPIRSVDINIGPDKYPCAIQVWYNEMDNKTHLEFYYNNIDLLIKK